MKNLSKMFTTSFGIALGQAIPLEENLIPTEGSAVIRLAQDMGLGGEARDIEERLEHIRTVYESQMR
jgi:hypothetical protein